jgi:DNA-directed RNA polymerase subunit RPC12/RpoP
MAAFLDRQMQGKQSVYKCLDCERQAMQMGQATPYLYNRVGKGSICPNCGGSNVQKISISMVLAFRWVEVRERLRRLRIPLSVQNNG